MRPFRTVGARLSVALLLVVAIALGLVYAVVVPSLENRLINSKLNALAGAAPKLARQYKRFPNDPVFAERAASQVNARVVIYDVSSRTPLFLTPIGDSHVSSNSVDVVNDPLARRAAVTFRVQRGTVTRRGERFAETAVPMRSIRQVLLLSAPLHDALANVDLVQRRLLIAGLIALLVALAIGYGAASLFARRIRRLERAADRIAGGLFDEPVTDSAQDELGELARGFERMRVRLAQLDHARREFVANASHELRTPLFSLGGFLELFEDEELDEPTRREFIATMRGQVERLAKLAEELLDLTRLDAGRLHVERGPVDLSALVGAVAAEFSPLARAEDHSLELDLDADVIALADEQRVHQIGRILVENALIHTPAGTRVRVAVAEENGEVVLSVTNNGPQIPPEHAEHLFERFYRAEGTRTSGSGLGLAIARELAELMNGTIGVESDRELTTFSLRLPAAEGSEGVDHVKTAADPREGSDRLEASVRQ